MTYGKAIIRYKGAHPILFTFTALSAGIGAIRGYKTKGITGAIIEGALGRIVVAILGGILETLPKAVVIKY